MDTVSGTLGDRSEGSFFGWITRLVHEHRGQLVGVARAETYITAVGCMATLGQIQQAVVRLRLLDDVPGEEAAAMLGISASKVAVLLHRAKSKLRTCIGEEAAWDPKKKSSPEMTGDLST